jgi:hypothetical protein
MGHQRIPSAYNDSTLLQTDIKNIPTVLGGVKEELPKYLNT